MTQLIVLDTVFDAPVAEVCAMSLSVKVHLDSMTHHRERVVAGRNTGHFVEGDVVTWSARHFGLPLSLTVQIFDVDAPHRFANKQVHGPFAAYHHEHLFEEIDGRTHMQDRLTFAAPFGPLGRLVEKLFLRHYMQTLLDERNTALLDTVTR
ncbi:SRPBCC family protein [Salinibacterium sp. NK8237]|uniref:SRPBCC family protein n=1 Tax=Salinibacterium sp. NK8237 TaxID=2792038 RepID=UPI0018CC942B|nr:SRPBCC family protein [Salinibacterium sp. NK8237]MBH0129564.1 SRPBCC family protein [Salinibacterium sp. NK8237]